MISNLSVRIFTIDLYLFSKSLKIYSKINEINSGYLEIYIINHMLYKL